MYQGFDLDIKDNQIGLIYNLSYPHPVGSSLYNSDKNCCYVNIPKNSSSTMKSILKNWEFMDFCRLDQNTEFLVILRDPTKRWISAVAEFLAGRHGLSSISNSTYSINEYDNLLKMPLVKQWIFYSVYLDVHCLPQCYFLQGLPLGRTKFFDHHNGAAEKISQYLNIDIGVDSLHANEGVSEQKKYITDWLTIQLNEDPKLQHILDVHYCCDHQLLDIVEVN